MKLFFETIGCRLNQSEIENLAAKFRRNGHEIVGDAKNADFAIVNTCVVTSAAGADSRKTIRRIAKSGCKNIVVTGCYATIYPDVCIQLPNVIAVFNNKKKDDIPKELFPEEKKDIQELDIQPRQPLPGDHKRTRAFIKVQDGCNNFCAFCITRIARGKSKSRSIQDIFKDIESALIGGTNEIVLTGVNLGSWGLDLEKKTHLPYLVKKIITDLSPNRIRLSSIEPWDFSEDYLSLFQFNSFCHHFHLPLQSGSDSILNAMRRRNSAKEYRDLILSLGSKIPNIAITTDVIVGFPGESENEFSESFSFIQSLKFADGHVFRYSPRQGTTASEFCEQVEPKIIRARARRMRLLFRGQKEEFMRKMIGSTVECLWEKSDKKENGLYLSSGFSKNYLRVHALSSKPIENSISQVKITEIVNGGLEGKIV